MALVLFLYQFAFKVLWSGPCLSAASWGRTDGGGDSQGEALESGVESRGRGMSPPPSGRGALKDSLTKVITRWGEAPAYGKARKILKPKEISSSAF